MKQIKNTCNGSRGCKIIILTKDKEVKKIIAKK